MAFAILSKNYIKSARSLASFLLLLASAQVFTASAQSAPDQPTLKRWLGFQTAQEHFERHLREGLVSASVGEDEFPARACRASLGASSRRCRRAGLQARRRVGETAGFNGSLERILRAEEQGERGSDVPPLSSAKEDLPAQSGL